MGARRVALLVLLAAGAACTPQGSPNGSPPPEPTDSAALSPTTVPSTTVAEPSSGASPMPAARPIEPGALEPGRYVTDGFAVPITIELGPGWSNSHVSESFVDLGRDEGVLSTGFLEGGTVSGFVRTARAAGLELSEPEPGVLDDLPSLRFSVSPVQDETVMYTVPAGTYRIQPGNSATVDLVRTSRGLLAVTTQAAPVDASAAQIAVDMVLATATVDAEPVRPLLLEETELDPASYESGVFGQRFSIELGDGWQAAHLGVPVVLLVNPDAALGVFLPDGLATPADLGRALEEVTGGHVRERAAERLARHDARAFDVTVDGQVPAFEVGGTPDYLFRGELARFWALPVQGRLVVVELSAPEDSFASALREARPELDSLEFEGAGAG
jgi:hypothetical protein